MIDLIFVGSQYIKEGEGWTEVYTFNISGKYAFLLDSVLNDYANSRQPCNTMRVGPELNSISYGVATSFRSPLRLVRGKNAFSPKFSSSRLFDSFFELKYKSG